MAYVKIYALRSTAEEICNHITTVILRPNEEALTRNGVVVVASIDSVRRACEIIVELDAGGFEFTQTELISYTKR